MSFLYTGWKNIAMTTGVNLSSSTLKWVGVDTGQYAPNQSTHNFLSDIPAGARIFTSAALTGVTVTGNVLDANDPATISGVTGLSVEAMVLYIDTGNAATSRLIFYCDSGNGLPYTPNSGNLVITHDNGANKIFAL